MSSADPTPPRDGRQLFAWAREQEQRHGCGMVRFLVAIGRRRNYPRKISAWNAVEAMEAYSQAVKALTRYLK